MWPFRKKTGYVDYSRLAEEDRKIMTKKQLEESDAEFREDSGSIITRILNKFRKL